MNPKIQAWLNTGLLGLALVGLVYVGTAVESVERRLDAVEAAAVDVQEPVRSRPGTARSRSGTAQAPAAQERPARASVAEGLAPGAGGEPDERGASSEWSEEQRARMQERWQRVRVQLADRAVDGVSEEFELDGETAEELRVLLNVYMEERTERWRALRDDPEIDPAQLQEDGEHAREAFEQEVEILIGEEGLSALQEALSRGRGF